MIDFGQITGVDWDKGNRSKNWDLHRVEWWEAEEIFFGYPLLIYPDPEHSRIEDRFFCLGRTRVERFLFVVFTVRANKIRVISARDMSKKERRIYDEASQEDSQV
ncbi:MAG: hypothetical protein AMJ65_09115 [Phycisphaerae bacterium SG8_4]|nr:MAG: hypothetical protein AMJ65_09115 [Phycisphaerae bacterium SG8_4]